MITKSQALKEWSSFVEEVNARTTGKLHLTSETDVQRRKRIASYVDDYSAFVEFYFPHYVKPGSTAQFQVDAALHLRDNPHARYSAQWARGHAKSTHFSVFIPMWLMATQPETINTVLMIGRNNENAIRLMSDIQAELKGNQLYIRDFGEQESKGNWQLGSFITNEGKFFKALGAGQAPRGLRNRENRPDYILLDDVDDDKLCQNDDRVEKLYQWCLEAVLGTMQMGRGRYIVVGNKISRNSIIQRFEDNEAFETTIINALDKEGNPSWSENFTKDEIETHIKTIGERAAQKELFNNPSAFGSVFKRDWLQFELSPMCDTYVSYIDPSFKDTKTSDYKAIVTVGKHRNHLFIVGIWLRKASVLAMAKAAYAEQKKFKSRIYIEANFAQDLLLKSFDELAETEGYKLPIRKDREKKQNKFQRIENISPLFEMGNISFCELIRDTIDCKTFISQLLAFEKGSAVNDDGPDALEGAISKLRLRKSSSKLEPFYSKFIPRINY